MTGLTEKLPHIDELRGQQLTEKTADTHVGVEVAFPADAATRRGIVTELRVEKRLLHEPGKRDGTVAPDVVSDKGDEGRRS